MIDLFMPANQALRAHIERTGTTYEKLAKKAGIKVRKLYTLGANTTQKSMAEMVTGGMHPFEFFSDPQKWIDSWGNRSQGQIASQSIGDNSGELNISNFGNIHKTPKLETPSLKLYGELLNSKEQTIQQMGERIREKDKRIQELEAALQSLRD